MGHSVEMTYFLHRVVFWVHMPIFFIISGFLFAHSNSITLSFGEIAYKRFKSLLLPYVITWLIIILLRMIVLFYRTLITAYNATDNLIFSITHSMNSVYPVMLKSGLPFLLSIFYGTGQDIHLFGSVIYTSGILWFLPSLFSATIIFYLFLKLFDKYSIAIQSIIIILLTFAGYMIGKYVFLLPWSIDISLVAQIFMVSGYLMRKHMIFEKKTPIWFFIAAAGIWLLDLYMGGIDMILREYNYLAISLIGAISASYLLMKLSFFLSNGASFYYKSISYIGRQSLVILCFHTFDIVVFPPMINYFALACLYQFQNNHWIILTGFRLCYSLLIAEMIKLLPLMKSVYYAGTSRIIEGR